MYDDRSVAVIIPAYNEQDHVAEVIDSIPAFVDRIYAIDDASEDDTWNEICAAAFRINPVETAENEPYLRRVVPIRHETNEGAGGAVITGYEHALADGIEVTAVMDGDGQMDSNDLDRIVDPVASGEVEYAKGNRLHRRSDRAPMSTWRLFGNAVLTMLTRVASGYWEMSDPQNGYTAISRDALSRLPLDRLYPGYGFLNDVLIHLNYNREPVGDVPHRGMYGDETSGIRYRQFVPGLSKLLASRFCSRVTRMYLVRKFHPLALCYAIGGIVSLGGLIGTGASLAGLSSSTYLGTLLGVALLTLGLTLLVLGAAFDVRENEGLVATFDSGTSSGATTVPAPGVTEELSIGVSQDPGGRGQPVERDEGE